MCGALVVAAFVLSFAPPGSLGPTWLTATAGVLALLWVLVAPGGGDRDNALPALAIVLTALGLALIARLSPGLAARQEMWLIVALVLSIGLAPGFAQFRRFGAYKYLWVVASLAL